MAETRLRGRCGYDANEPFRVTVHQDKLNEPDGWKKPRGVFVVSMGDLFHPDVPGDVITRIIDNCIYNWSRHRFFFLTKRPERMWEFFNDYIPADNIYLGVTIEKQEYVENRLSWFDDLYNWNKFISVEPMLGPVTLSPVQLTKLDWVICGGEQAKKGRARVCRAEWVKSLLNQCINAGVPFFFKQPGDNFKGDWCPFGNYKELPNGLITNVKVRITNERGINV